MVLLLFLFLLLLRVVSIDQGLGERLASIIQIIYVAVLGIRLKIDSRNDDIYFHLNSFSDKRSEFLARLDLLVLTGEEEQEAGPGRGRDLLPPGRHVTGLPCLGSLLGEGDLEGERDSETSSTWACKVNIITTLTISPPITHRPALGHHHHLPLRLRPLQTFVLHVQLVVGQVVPQPGLLHLQISQEVPQLIPLVSRLSRNVLRYDQSSPFQESQATEYLLSLFKDLK